MKLIKLDNETKTMIVRLYNYLDKQYDNECDAGKDITFNYNDIATIDYKVIVDDDTLTIMFKNGVKVVYDSGNDDGRNSTIDFEKHFSNVGEFVCGLLNN